jgi:hypothetical protein
MRMTTREGPILMPYDVMPDDASIAQMRAEMLRRFDDGDSLVGQNPDLLQVGLFGRAPKKPAPPVDLSRRSAMGLPEIPIPMAGESKGQLVPRPNDVPPPSTLPPPPAAPQQQQQQQQATQQQPANPLGQVVNKALNAPVSRRQVLQRAGSAALQQALPTPKATDIVSPLTNVIKPPQTGFIPNPDIDFFLKDYLHQAYQNAYEQEPGAVAQSMWLFMRDYLKDRMPEDKFSKLDKLANLKNGKFQPYSDDISDDDAHELSVHLQSHINELKPHELIDVLDNLWQNDHDPIDLHYELKQHYKPPELPTSSVIEQRNKALGLKPRNDYHGRLKQFNQLTDEPIPSFENISPSAFEQYIENSYQHNKYKPETPKD